MTGKYAIWRTPAVILTCGCLIAVIAFGPRSTLGFFMTPMVSLNGWGRDVFAFAIAIQNILWGFGQPFGGIAFERTGSYELMWWLAILSGVLSAIINVPIVEKPVARPAAAST